MSRNTCGEGKYQVWLEKKEIGDELVYLIGGGEQSHIGGVTICVPGEEPKNMELHGHRDCVITEIIAKAACKKYNTKVSCVGGVHIDNANKDEIKRLVKNCRGLIKWI